MRFLDYSEREITANLAIDDALLQEAEDCEVAPILRVWEQPDFAVVLGASGRIAEDVRREACEADGVPLARRSSGGGTVLVGPGALNFAIVLPIGFDPSFAAVDLAQKWILARSAEGLNRFRPGGSPRIEVLGSGDLTIDRRKISGSAQRRLRKHLLVHATFLHDFPLDKIGRYLAAPRRQPDYREGRPHSTFLANDRTPRASLVEGLRWAWQADEFESVPSESILKSARELADVKLARSEWIERL